LNQCEAKTLRLAWHAGAADETPKRRIFKVGNKKPETMRGILNNLKKYLGMVIINVKNEFSELEKTFLFSILA
jgi:hypothetical protein